MKTTHNPPRRLATIRELSNVKTPICLTMHGVIFSAELLPYFVPDRVVIHDDFNDLAYSDIDTRDIGLASIYESFDHYQKRNK